MGAEPPPAHSLPSTLNVHPHQSDEDHHMEKGHEEEDCLENRIC